MTEQEYMLNFIDYRKAFDGINRKYLWKILWDYQVPSKKETLSEPFTTAMNDALLTIINSQIGLASVLV